MNYKIPHLIQEVIAGARERQIREHGNTEHDAYLSPGTWGLIAGEEYGEWCLSLLQDKDAFDKAAHVAAVMIAFMEAYIHNNFSLIPPLDLTPGSINYIK